MAFFQGYKIIDRVAIFTFTVKNKSLILGGPSLSKIHELRQGIIDLLKPDARKTSEMKFEYSENGRNLYFYGRYDGGMEGEWDVRNQWVNSFPVRIHIEDPMLYEDSQEVYSLDFQDTFNPGATKITALSRRFDKWSVMSSSSTGPNNNIFCMAIGKNGEVYAGGEFTSIDGIAGTLRIAYWDGTTWTQMNGGANGSVRALAVGPDGSVYAAGEFTTIGGVAANKIAKWNGTSWSALGTGINNTGFAICVAPNGIIYAGGDFTTAGGVTVNRIARWDGLVWRTVGTGTPGLASTVRSIVNWIDGITLYVGGDFANSVTTLNITTNLFTPTNVLLNTGSCRTLAVNRLSGEVYAGGVSLGTGSGNTSLASYNQANWKRIDTGSNEFVSSLAIDIRGYVYVGGGFTTIGNISARYFAVWNGTSWDNTDIIPNSPGAAYIRAIAISLQSNDIFIGLEVTTASNTYIAGVTNVTNIGSAFCNPIFRFVGPGRLIYIENRTDLRRMFFNLDVLPGEELFVDTARARVYIPTRGMTMYGIFPSSALGLMKLMPGDNFLHVLFFKDVGATAQVFYTPTHWSVDAVGKSER